MPTGFLDGIYRKLHPAPRDVISMSAVTGGPHTTHGGLPVCAGEGGRGRLSSPECHRWQWAQLQRGPGVGRRRVNLRGKLGRQAASSKQVSVSIV